MIEPEIVELPRGGVRVTAQRPTTAGGAREPARVITMAWGDRYISDLLSLTMPALLAPGNVPALVEQFDAEFVIVTEMRFFDRIARAPVVARLLQHCDLRLLPIDDLLSQWYGITLTYALVRGFADLGEAMTDTHLFFVNADFIVADGSYRRLAEAIRRGARLAVSPSYCMILEDTVDQLRARYDPETCTLSLRPRDMARMIIAHRHNTVRAKTVNQQLFRIHRYDQFYWYVDEQTLLGHQMPIAVIYMRPERVLTEMPTFWDYGVISEFCPTATPCVLGDSDDFLMGELRAEGTFRELLHLGWPTVAEIAADLSSYTTKDHRDYGRHTLVLHGDDVPPHVAAEKAKLRQFVDAVYGRLSPPIGYRNHPFWAAAFPRFLAVHLDRRERMRAEERARAALSDDPIETTRRRRLAELKRQSAEIDAECWPVEEEISRRSRELLARVAELDADLRRQATDATRALEALRHEREQRLHTLLERAARLERERLQLLAERQEDIHRRAATELGRRTPAVTGDGGASDADPAAADALRSKLALLVGLYHRLFGQLPETTRWNPYHTVLRHAHAAVKAVGDRADDVLVISSGGTLGALLARCLKGRKVTILPSLMSSVAGAEILGAEPRFALCICDLDLDGLLVFRDLFDRIRPVMAKAGKVIVFHHNAGLRPLDAWTSEFTKRLFPLVGASRIFLAGSTCGALAMRWFARMLERHDMSSSRGLAIIIATLAVCGPLARIGTWIEDRRSPQALPARCTSMTIEFDL